MIERGKFNVYLGVFGVPGVGKSEYGLRRAVEYGRSSYLLVHDLGYRCPEKFHDGTPTGIVRHDSIAACKSRLATDPRGAHAISVPDAEEVIALAAQITDAQFKKDPTRCIPVTVLIDEAVSARGAGLYRLGEEMRQVAARRRHMSIGIIYTCQSVRLCHNQMLTQATELVCFRMHDRRDHRKLLDIGFTDEEVSKIAALPNFQYFQKKLS